MRENNNFAPLIKLIPYRLFDKTVRKQFIGVITCKIVKLVITKRKRINILVAMEN